MKNHPNARENVQAIAVELRAQEIPLDAPESRFQFDIVAKQFVVTRGAMEAFGPELVQACLAILRTEAIEHSGLERLQTFLIGATKQKLWIVEDGEVITALLPHEY